MAYTDNAYNSREFMAGDPIRPFDGRMSVEEWVEYHRLKRNLISNSVFSSADGWRRVDGYGAPIADDVKAYARDQGIPLPPEGEYTIIAKGMPKPHDLKSAVKNWLSRVFMEDWGEADGAKQIYLLGFNQGAFTVAMAVLCFVILQATI